MSVSPAHPGVKPGFAAADNRAMRLSPWQGYLALALGATGAYVLSPAGTWLQTAWFVLIGLSSGVAIVAAMLLHRPSGAVAWLLFAAGVSLNALGTAVEAVMERVLHIEPFPSPADAFYFALYPALVAGLVVLVRRRSSGRDLSTLVDAATISTGFGLLAWVFMIHPAGDDPTLGLFGHVVSVAYPVGDLVLLAIMLRLLLGAGSRNSAFLLMAASLLLFLAGDAAWAVINQVGWTPGVLAEHLLQMNFLTAYALFGAAALHPSVRDVGEQAPARRGRLSPAWLVLLTAASLIAPAVLYLEAVRHEVVDGVAIALASATLFVLVVIRVSLLLRQVEAQARQLRELAWIDELTGLPNRRAWSAELPRAIERARREGVRLSIAMLDLDYFKRFNDEHGHPAGDRLLKGASAAWSGALRAVDQLARYGGEEFIVLLPDSGGAEAADVLERLRAVTPSAQTFSAGLATWDGVETSDELITRADRALYEAKNTGRNRIVLAVEGDSAATELAAP